MLVLGRGRWTVSQKTYFDPNFTADYMKQKVAFTLLFFNPTTKRLRCTAFADLNLLPQTSMPTCFKTYMFCSVKVLFTLVLRLSIR